VNSRLNDVFCYSTTLIVYLLYNKAELLGGFSTELATSSAAALRMRKGQSCRRTMKLQNTPVSALTKPSLY
jgi:hypothetical protein